MAGDSGFVTALAINLVIATVIVLLFVVLRRRFDLIYQPRTVLLKTPPPLLNTNRWFTWINPVLKVSDDEFYEQVRMRGMCAQCDVAR